MFTRQRSAGWLVPPSDLHHVKFTIKSMHFNDNQDTGSDGELSFFWLNVNKASGHEWTRLSDCTTFDMDDVGDDVISFDKPNATFDFYTSGKQQFHVQSSGYEQDSIDDLFRVRGLVNTWFGLAGAYVFGSGENDDFFPLAMDVLSPEDTPPGNDGAGPYRQPFDQLNPDGKFVMTFDVQLMDPVLATMQDGGELRLNMGPYAVDRVNGDTTDGNENFTVRYVSMEADGSETISVSAFGYTQTYSGVRKIYAEGGFGVDTLVLAGTLPGPPTYTPDDTGLPGNGTLTLGGSKITFTGLEFVRPVPPKITSLHFDPALVNEGGAVTLSGEFLDPGSLETHVVQIDWDDGTPPDTLNLGAGVPSFSSGAHRFLDNASRGEPYVITARVTERDGNSTSTGISVMVNNVPPTATLTNGGPVDEGSPGLVRFTDPSDPSPVDTAAGFRYSYDFDNDGVFEIADSRSASAVVPASYLAVGPGMRTVRARISDKDGGFTDYTTPILINSVPPTVNVGPDATITQGDSLSRIGSFSDPGADTWTATVDYGDGSGSQPLALNAGKTFRLNHTYASAGTFPVTVVVMDGNGNGSVGLDSFLVVVAPLSVVPPPPVPQPRPSPTPMVGPVPITTFAGQFPPSMIGPVPMTSLAGQLPQVQVHNDFVKAGSRPLSVNRTVNLKRANLLSLSRKAAGSQRLAIAQPHPAGPHVYKLTNSGRPRSRPL